jgi:hypothetical protein
MRDLEGKGVSAGTCYQHACLLSSFYSWAMKDPEVGECVRRNLARLARPKAPNPYQTGSVKLYQAGSREHGVGGAQARDDGALHHPEAAVGLRPVASRVKPLDPALHARAEPGEPGLARGSCRVSPR